MQSLKSAARIIGALIPLLYCGGLLFYFANAERFTGVPIGNGLAPAILGLGVVSILFSIPLVLRVARLFRTPAPPRGTGRSGPTPQAEPSDFDPDAAIARYLAQRGEPGPPVPVPTRPGFGRKRS